MCLVTNLSRRATLAWIVLAITALGARGATIAVTRGPYLQQGTTNSIVIRWRTDTATDSLVHYGLGPGDWSGQAGDGVLDTNHIVEVGGLSADTRYYYEIGSTNGWFPGDTNDFFVTSPPVGTPKPTRLWVLGDSGTANSEAMAVRDAYAIYGGARPTDLWLMLGDNAYSNGTDAEYQAAVFDIYPTFLRNSVLWPTLGNHDSGSTSPTGTYPYFDIFTLPQNGEAGGLPSGTEHYYSFDYANLHLVCLDSTSSDRGSNGPMCTWLRSDLAATVQDWVIAYWHHPPYTKGSHDSDTESNLIQMRQNVVPILEDYGVDLVLCGHSHSYERSFLLDGHYGFSGNLTPAMILDNGSGREDGTGAYRKAAATPGHQGAVYSVAGSSGHTSSGPLNHPAMFLSLEVLGSLVIDVSGQRLDLVFLQTNALAGDYFTILKEPPPTNAPAGPVGLVATPGSGGQIRLSWIDQADNEAGFKLERSTNGVDYAQVALFRPNMTNGVDAELAPVTTYYYQLLAYNAAGESPVSNVAQATTLDFTNSPADLIPPAAVTNLAASTPTTNSITLRWSAPGDDGNIGSAARYDLRYAPANITEANWTSAIVVPGAPAPAPAGTPQTFIVGALSAGRTYYFALKTADETNNVSPLSNVAVASTPGVAPTGLVQVVLIASNSVWKYLANGSDQGSAWTAPGFGDSTWAAGPAQLGYGSGHEATVVSYGPNSSAKYITTYFRRHFAVSDPTALSSLSLSVQRDDGAVVFLNGQEVFRSNMPTGAVNYLTPAPLSVTGTDKTSFHASPPLPASLLVPGDNVAAAEIHQHSGSSSSMDFNLQLLAMEQPAPPLIHIAVSADGHVSLGWVATPGKTYRVEYETNLTSHGWTALGGNIVATNSPASTIDPTGSGRQRFYRVVRLD